MSNKMKYSMPADEEDDDVIEDGEEMVDMQDSHEDEAVDNYESDDDQANEFDPEDVQAPEDVDHLLVAQMDSEDMDQSENKRPNGQV